MIYLYKITNLINDKIYIGIHRTFDINDNYFGSGTAIKKAIKKHGIENFQKEILEYFDNYSDALNREQEIVNESFVSRDDTYNLRTGGVGGFEHINNIPKEKRPNLKRLKEKLLSGEIKVGGTQNWSKDSWIKVRSTSWSSKIKDGWSPNNWAKMGEEQKENVRKKISNSVIGEKNSQYGTKFYIHPDDLSTKIRFKEGSQPAGWLWVKDFYEQQKKNSKRWYNDGIKNYYLILPNPLIDELGLVKGRIR